MGGYRLWVAKLVKRWVAKLVAHLLATAALKNTKWVTLAKEWPTHSSTPKNIHNKALEFSRKFAKKWSKWKKFVKKDVKK